MTWRYKSVTKSVTKIYDVPFNDAISSIINLGTLLCFGARFFLFFFFFWGGGGGGPGGSKKPIMPSRFKRLCKCGVFSLVSQGFMTGIVIEKKNVPHLRFVTPGLFLCYFKVCDRIHSLTFPVLKR